MKNLPIWLKFGIGWVGFYILLVILSTLEAMGYFYEIGDMGGIIGFILAIISLPIMLLFDSLFGVHRCAHQGTLCIALFNIIYFFVQIIYFFLIGSIIGIIVQKIKNVSA